MSVVQQRKWNRVTVVGCGLIGGSFALSLRRAGVCDRLAGWDVSPAVLDEALARGVIDEIDRCFAHGDGGVSSSDLIYLAMPVRGIVDFLRGRHRQISPEAIVTDAGSTKLEVCRAARRYLPDAGRFIGGHPVAGSHHGGLAHARADLLAGAPYVLIAEEDVDESTRRSLTAFEETLSQLGARVTLMSADEHDRALALISHLPQIVSSALAAVVKDRPNAETLLDLSGAGYRDMTRLAASSWSMWRDIVATNPAHIAAALDALIEKLAAVRTELRDSSERADARLKATGELFSDSQPSPPVARDLTAKIYDSHSDSEHQS